MTPCGTLGIREDSRPLARIFAPSGQIPERDHFRTGIRPLWRQFSRPKPDPPELRAGIRKTTAPIAGFSCGKGPKTCHRLGLWDSAEIPALLPGFLFRSSDQTRKRLHFWNLDANPPAVAPINFPARNGLQAGTRKTTTPIARFRCGKGAKACHRLGLWESAEIPAHVRGFLADHGQTPERTHFWTRTRPPWRQFYRSRPDPPELQAWTRRTTIQVRRS